MIRNKKITSSLFGLFFTVATGVQLFSVLPASAINQTPAPVSGGSIYSRATLDTQLKIIKYYDALSTCFAQHLTYPVSEANMAAPKWFGSSGDTQENVGVIADTDDHNGIQSCDDIVKNTMKSLFGWSSYTEAAKAIGLNNSDTRGTPAIDLLGKHLFNTTSPDLSSLYSANGMRYYDLFYTAQLSVCGAHVTSSQTDQDVIGNPSTYKIYVVDGTSGKAKTEYWTFPKANDHSISYGFSTDGTTGASGKLSCVDIAKKLGQAGPANAYAAYVKAHPNEAPPDVSQTGGDGAEPSTCNIDGIGWIVCPVLNFMANIVDQSYRVVNAMLTVNAFGVTGTDTDKQLQTAWSNMRNIANIAFVAAFMFIIYSQITGFGVSNYGIKKMLPRIIIAAILVNASYWLCAIAVDISNVFGASMKTLFSGLGGTFNPGSPSWATGTGWVGIVGGVVAGSVATGALLFVGLAALVPALVAALLAIVTVLLVLVIRQALIILLIVVAPLAFVAFLLPNTQQWFKKWRELFQILLLMYPIIGAIFGASQLASSIVMNSASGYSDEGLKMAIQVMGAAIAIIPLFITPVVMKTAGGVLNNIAGKINNPNKGPFDRMRKGAEGFRDSSKSAMRARRLNGNGKNAISRGWRRTAGLSTRVGVGMKAKSDRNKAAESAAEAGVLATNKAAIEASRLNMAESNAKSALQSQAVQGIDARIDQQLAAIGQARNKDGTIKGVTPEADIALRAGLRAQISQGERQATQERESLIAAQDVSQLGKTMEAAIKSGDKFTVLAAQNKLSGMGNAGVDKIASVIEKREAAVAAGETNKNWDEIRTEMARSMGPIMSKNESLKKWATSTSLNEDGVLNSDKSLADIKQEVLAAGGAASGMSVEKLAQQTPQALLEMLQAGSISKDTIGTALSERNIGSFDKAVIQEMRKQTGIEAPQSDTAGKLEIVHSSAPTQPQTEHQRDREAGGNFNGPR